MPRADFRKTIVRLAPAIAAACLVYFGGLSGEFVYDDNEQIVKNPWVHEVRYLPEILTHTVWAYQTPEPTNYYRPVQMGLYNLAWSVLGGSPRSFHAVNLLFHLLCVAALFFLARELSRDDVMTAGAALLFAVHPLNTEAVAWIACLPDLTYAFFVMTTLFLHARSRRAAGRRRGLLEGLAVAAYLLGLFSKETAVALLPLVFLLEIWIPRGDDANRIARPPSDRGGRRKKPWSSFSVPAGQLARALLPYALATLGYLLLRLAVVGGIAPRDRKDLTALDALLNAPALLLSYLRAMVAPVRLLAIHVLERVPSAGHVRFIGCALGVAAFVFLVVRLSRRRPDLAFAGSLILLPLLPVLYIPALGENAFAERYSYLATAGFAWLAAGALTALIRSLRGIGRHAAWAGALMFLAMPCAWRTVTRTADWHDDRRLATATLRDEPRAWQMHVVLASWYYRHDQLEQALATLERGLTVVAGNPRLEAEATGLRLQLHRIRPEEAIRDFRRIAATYPAFYEAEYCLGDAYLKIDRPAEAAAAFRRAIAINPLGIEAHEGLFVALVAQGRSVDWRSSRERLSTPMAPRAMDKLLEGVAQEKAGRLDDAEASLQEALRLDPKSDRALLSLAVVENRRGRYAEAADYCRRALALKPASVEIYEQLGVSVLNLGEVEEAVEALEKAVALDPSDKEAQNRLGVAYAKGGRQNEAREAFRKALSLDPAFEKARFNLERLEREVVAEGAR
ncbi:MAG TPA: tetratricopeptide repeat protein [Candidatus Polarisedimenticolia bacterium]|jgi:tetratricopeptide (TPR) repeat protein|nr:tetratricopeptide repeat protein [Candidatus Polarisedimenticolia bacterium]